MNQNSTDLGIPQSPNPDAPYLLSDTSAEHERLIRQASVLEPFTERLFRDAGIGLGQRVLDVGSGVGDVALLAARIVGSSGAVVGVERDPATLAAARARVAKAGYENVSFIETDIAYVGGKGGVRDTNRPGASIAHSDK